MIRNKAHFWGMVLATLFMIGNWVLVAVYYNRLPNIIPAHFGPSGLPDYWIQKEFWSVFLSPIIQTIMVALFLFLYRFPQYSNIPTTIILMGIEKEKREKIFEMIRNLLVITLLWINLFLGYISYVIIGVALDKIKGLQPIVTILFLVTFFVWLIYYIVKMIFKTKEIMGIEKIYQ